MRRLIKALPLLALLSTVSALSTIHVDPVNVQEGDGIVDQTKVPGVQVASFRKQVVHINTQYKRNMSVRIPKKDEDIPQKDVKPGFTKGPFNLLDTYVSLINATPYRWHLTYNSSYQLKNWDHEWPTYIMPGASVTVHANNHGQANDDSAGEATYELEQTKQPASFQVQYRSGTRHDVWIQFRDQLKTLNNDVGSELNLGFLRTPGGVGFVLAGKEGDFVSNNGPAQWMQSQLSDIGHLPLRELLLPRSHDSGMWVGNHRLGVGLFGSSLTQNKTLYYQLDHGGIRVVDYRPFLLRKSFYAAHGVMLGPFFHGYLGASLTDMIAEFNNFTQQHPGELYIWDMHGDDARSGDRHYQPLNDTEFDVLFQELKTIRWRAAVPDNQDLTLRPLNSFISPETRQTGRSSVLIRVPASWAMRTSFPGPKEGFISAASFPLTSRRTKTEHLNNLVVDQIKRLREARPSRNSTMHNMDWFFTQTDYHASFPWLPITELSRASWRALYGRFWRALSDTTYPNMMSLDAIHDSSLKALAMVVNKCLAARRCGSLGGKVTVPKRKEDVDKEGGVGW
ncbi:hypothetical protein E4U54_003272 [Claviceps lovelessii]|nr:hypothetical protein E4U54_003272 [Claviceps lovelessii]